MSHPDDIEYECEFYGGMSVLVGTVQTLVARRVPITRISYEARGDDGVGRLSTVDPKGASAALAAVGIEPRAWARSDGASESDRGLQRAAVRFASGAERLRDDVVRGRGLE